MKRTQVSTNIGFISLIGGFLQIYQDVKVVDFFTVFQSLTYGEVVSMVAPFIAGVWAIIHDEKRGLK